MMSTLTSCHRGGGDGIGLYHTYRRVVVGGFLIASFPDAQALAPVGAVAAAACCQDHVNNGAIEVSHAMCIDSSILDTTINDDDIDDNDDNCIVNGCRIATNACMLDGGGSGRQCRVMGGCIIASFPDAQAPVPAGAGAVAVCRCCQDHVNNVVIEVSRATCVDLSILDMTIDDNDIYPAR